MHESLQALKAALGYAKFDDISIHNRTLTLIDEIGSDLEVQEYAPSPDVSIAQQELTEAIDNYDQEVEALDRAVKESREETPAEEEEEG